MKSKLSEEIFLEARISYPFKENRNQFLRYLGFGLEETKSL